MVYVLDYNGQPLMPTERHGKVRRLLNNNKARVANELISSIQEMVEKEKFAGYKYSFRIL